MRACRVIRVLVICYVSLCIVLAVFLGELAFRPQRIPLRERQSAKAIAARFGADLQNVTISARDGVQLQGWFASPANANGHAVILLHGVGDNREGMGGFAELFLSKGYAVLLPDSRAAPVNKIVLRSGGQGSFHSSWFGQRAQGKAGCDKRCNHEPSNEHASSGD